MRQRLRTMHSLPKIISVVLLVLLSGCGKGNYDKLVKTRIDQLSQPHKYGILIWKDISTEFEYSARMPMGEETVSDSDENGVKTEQRDVVFGSKRYQLVYTEFAQNAQPDEVASQVEQSYLKSGYAPVPTAGEEGEEDVEDGGEEANDASFEEAIPAPNTVKSLNLVNEEGIRARVEVVPVGNRAVATLAVIAADLTEADCTEFFRSVQRAAKQRRR